MALKPVSLDDKYDLSQERVFVSGTQALVRLALMQKERDRRAGLNTAGYVTGYRGSPLGGLDQQFGRADRLLKANDIKFQPGLNEDLAATALWGSQQAELRGEGRFDGVFGLWYGKGPGVDRSGDVFRHANNAGTAKHGGVIALMGDDHTCESSTTAHQSEFHFVDVMIPVLNPAGVQEIIDYGLHAWALSRFSGTWVGLKAVKDTIESTGIVDGRLDRVSIVTPTDFAMPPGGLNIRLGDTPIAQEERLQEFKRDAILHYLRANRLNRFITSGGARPRIGIATVGKSYLDVRLALDELGIDEVRANDLGIRIWKVACPWPLETQGLQEFARGLDLIMVVEEKRSLIEVQVREELYGTANQPVCIGKKDEQGRWMFPVKGALDPNDIAIQLGRRLLAYGDMPDIAQRVGELEEAQRVLAATGDVANRIPYFCSGCPHNTSTKVPEGMRAYAGIGCHYMVQWMDRETTGFTQMGGEGANWIGEAPFSKRGHVFQNLGDGTYNHSGYLALRASIASGVNVTYKLLFNDAVAMTGGQHHEGDLTVPVIARQVAAEGAKRVVVVTDEPDKYPPNTLWPGGLTIRHRDDLDEVQRELAQIPGVTVLIYDQTCASEKRRRRKRGAFPDPDKRVIINERVCEGCGDCGVKSNCVSVQPLATEWGRKREIDQSSCNKDFSCVNGFCPSFVTVHGAKPKKAAGAAAGGGEWAALPVPVLPEIDGTYGIIATGVGGTGVVTIGAIIGMAAHLEGKACGMIDMAGLAQKGGAVYSHIRLARDPADITAIRVPARGADVVLGGDIVVAGTKKVLAAVKPGKTLVVVNTHEVLPGDFTRNADYSLPTERIKRTISQAAGPENTHFIEANRLATALFGNSLAQNIFMVGYAYQFGALPVSAEAIERAIELNGEAVAMNKAAFLWGRRAAYDPARVEQLAAPKGEGSPARRLSQDLDEVIARRVADLTLYQDAAYAARYRALVEKVRAAEAARAPGRSGLAEAVARNLYKLMAYKDEYEVARLFTDGDFLRQVDGAFDGTLRFEFHMAPPLLARANPATGEPRKMSFGPWMLKALGVLAKFKGLRGTALDVFGYSAERRTERRLVADYERTIGTLLPRLDLANHAVAVAIAAIPEKIRGYGPVKERHLAAAKAEEASLLARFDAPAAPAAVAAE
ncbi:indolepyruvate ferredoxin oxidoreductase family protein [Xanthobacter tagetidis]|uniref:Indolepyruvate ferredoxin oxidoreductase family protein n=1 Tax=Xanthobacter tagetidis TaxID=60216 RepID=A0A3L7AA71_9HYPH|nr:indolepyruvate ferredoxin oxidoreductase family protein [Xanthobacter tagetidis]MBB6309416.1 indolepyruvate ferredoxin oxidoreductase [Xanthobacter tagetidis]RLP76718.1 indolepyruvate ferredoxin oxidoreductase family protein [Xanthobacter tagetidis]